MIPELGQISLILALLLAVVQGTLPLVGAQTGRVTWMQLAIPAARAQLLFVAVAYACLTYVMVNNDFSVLYAYMHTNSELPLLYRISGVWAAHEGSLLLWTLILALWTGAVTLAGRDLPIAFRSRVVAVLGLVSVGFLLFLIVTSNPFERLLSPVPVDGRDLNPLLQDPGLAIHPPMLYMGYVGFAVPFAFAIAAMLGGRLDTAWARWSRPWTQVAWLFLTIGIALGSWWAYYELGWGGWWFWDPVENASFMPWLVGTALMHSLAVTEKRGTFKAWTTLLAIFTFSLSLLGTFLVRSGVLTSVHSFAADPERGLFILVFLLIVIGGSLLLYSLRAANIRSSVSFDALSREAGLLVNNMLLVVFALAVLIGTLAPLVNDFLIYLKLADDKLSIGFPYFNFMFLLLMAPLALAVGWGMVLRWKSDKGGRVLRVLAAPAIWSIALGVLLILLLAPFFHWKAALGLTLALWVALVTLQSLYQRSRTARGWRGIPRGFWGMTLAHLGIAVFAVGVSLTSIYTIEKDIRLAPGQSYELGAYRFQFKGVKEVKGPNYDAAQGHLIVFKGDTKIAELHPQKRIYRAQQNPMTEAGIDAGLNRDLFVALGEPLGTDGSWSLRVHHKPFVRWIWLGCIFMALGGLVAATDPRFRRQRQRASAPAGGAEAAA